MAAEDPRPAQLLAAGEAAALSLDHWTALDRYFTVVARYPESTSARPALAKAATLAEALDPAQAEGAHQRYFLKYPAASAAGMHALRALQLGATLNDAPERRRAFAEAVTRAPATQPDVTAAQALAWLAIGRDEAARGHPTPAKTAFLQARTLAESALAFAPAAGPALAEADFRLAELRVTALGPRPTNLDTVPAVKALDLWVQKAEIELVPVVEDHPGTPWAVAALRRSAALHAEAMQLLVQAKCPKTKAKGADCSSFERARAASLHDHLDPELKARQTAAVLERTQRLAAPNPELVSPIARLTVPAEGLAAPALEEAVALDRLRGQRIDNDAIVAVGLRWLAAGALGRGRLAYGRLRELDPMDDRLAEAFLRTVARQAPQDLGLTVEEIKGRFLPRADLLVLGAALLLEAAECDAAFDTQLRMAETDPRVWEIRGAVAACRNDLKGARSAFEQAIARNPGAVDANVSLALLEAQAADAATNRTGAEAALDRACGFLSMVPADARHSARYELALTKVGADRLRRTESGRQATHAER